MNVLNALANSLEIDTYNKVVKKESISLFRSPRNETKPILQLSRFPLTIDINQYKNALSASNPEGDLRPLFEFRQLVDPIPEFDQMYIASTSSTEMLYSMILNGANILPDSHFAASVINNSRKIFEATFFSNMDGTPGEWRPIYAVPDDWHSADDNRFKSLTIDLRNMDPSTSFEVISGNEKLNWILDGNTEKSLDPNTQIASIEMKYMLVGLHRPWFNPLLFQTRGWYISGENAGFCSSGSMKSNDGVLPIIPASILIGKQTVINASWNKEDQSIIDSYQASGKPMHLGPFLVSTSESNILQIIGWISELIPFSPKNNKQLPRSITVDN